MAVPAFQTMLFTPGNRPDRVRKALDGDADLVCIDLEDAVPADDKRSARAEAMAILGDVDDDRASVRINNLRSRHGLDDMRAVLDLPSRPAWLFVPMVETRAEIEIIHALLADDRVRIVPLIETVAGLRAADQIATAPGVGAMMFGGGDLAAELGVELAWEPLVTARGQFIMSCAQAGVRAIDVPFIHTRDEAGLADETRRAKALGFVGKAAIHPAQVPVIRDIFRPTADEIARARAAIEVFRKSGGRAVAFDGLMLDVPIVRRFEDILSFESEEDHA